MIFRLVGVLLCLASVARADALSSDEARLRDAIAARRAPMIAQLESLVAVNSGSWNVPGLRRVAGSLGGQLERLGFAVELREGGAIEYPQGARATGPIVLARRAAARSGPALLLVGHMDTVFEPGEGSDALSAPDASGRARGSGAVDMKGGLVVMIEALRALEASGDLDRAAWTVLLNSDEEVGSLASRATIEAEARRADWGFVFEAAREDGALVRSRRGLGQFIVSVQGVAAHAGGSHRDGRSAVVELAHKVLEIESWTDYERGVTLNAGIFSGGTKRNVVPNHAEAWIDLRYDAPELGEQIRERLEALAKRSHVPGTRTSVWGSLHRPPKLDTPATRRLLDLQAGVARALGAATAEPLHAGGGTDGSLMAAVGLPTLDSMGVRGGAAHTPREYIALDSLTERAAIAAITLRRIIEGRLDAPTAHR